MKKLQPRHYIYIVLSILIIASYAATLVVWRHQRDQINSLDSKLTTLSENQTATNSANYIAVTIEPSENIVYFPLARIKLPASSLNEGLVYTYTATHTISGDKKVFPAELDISTHELANNDYSTTQQFDCSQVAYADFVTPSYPINPKYKPDGSIKLTDGRTMNIYYAPSIPGCKQAWQLSGINSKAIGDSLKQAASY